MIGLFFKQLLSRILTGLLTLSMGALSILSGVGTAEPEPVPEDFTPVLRFAAASDVHLNGEPDQPAALPMACTPLPGMAVTVPPVMVTAPLVRLVPPPMPGQLPLLLLPVAVTVPPVIRTSGAVPFMPPPMPAAR